MITEFDIFFMMCLVINNVVMNVFLNFEGNSDIERYQMANKKIPFKFVRPVEEWLQEKGNFRWMYLIVLSVLM